MTPNIKHGEHLLVNQLAYINLKVPLQHQIIVSNNPSRGDIVIFKAPKNTKKNLIKRVIGLPGDTVEIIHGRNGGGHVFNVADSAISLSVFFIVIFYKKIVRDEDFQFFNKKKSEA